jgi:hypothetical protein
MPPLATCCITRATSRSRPITCRGKQHTAAARYQGCVQLGSAAASLGSCCLNVVATEHGQTSLCRSYTAAFLARQQNLVINQYHRPSLPQSLFPCPYGISTHRVNLVQPHFLAQVPAELIQRLGTLTILVAAAAPAAAPAARSRG